MVFVVSPEAAQLVSGEIDARQRAIDAQGVGDCSDSLCVVGALLSAILVSPDAAQLVSGEVDARQRAVDAKSGGEPPDAILLASDLSQAGVTGSLTKIE